MMLHEKGERERGSFRDPSGYLFEEGGALYRRIESCYGSHFDTFWKADSTAELVDTRLLIPHTQVSEIPEGHENAHAVIQPERVSFISYPYEWSFHQLRDAALTTLDVHRRALKHQMILRMLPPSISSFIGGEPPSSIRSPSRLIKKACLGLPMDNFVVIFWRP